MRPPAFWFTPPGRPAPAARALAPLAAAYAAATARRIARARPLHLPVPVICIGNLNAGGTGKTPAVIALAQRLAARGIEVHIVTRGHGGRLAGPVRVDPRRHAAAETGDEALLHAAFAPTWVARDRAAGAQAAHQAGARAILLDDGHQNPALAKALSIVVVDAARGFGNGRVLPAGPLREPVATGLARADLLLSLGDAAAQARFRAAWGHVIGDLPHLTGALAPLPTGLSWAGRRVLAFAGIGDPDKFFATLRGLGANLVRTVPLGDHQPVPPALLARLEAEARHQGAELVTTEKDAVRLAPADRGRVLTLPVRLELDDWTALDAALSRLGLGPPAPG
jgi:tetraacyldisaccharide 4'-kinase